MRQIKISQTITVRSDTVDQYLREISKRQRVSVDEEAELAARVREGDLEARNRLIEANLRFVVSVAKQYQGSGLELCDIINEGNLGLVKAIDKYDPQRGFKLISYAVWWIRQSILAAIAEQGRMVRLPLNQVATITKINRAVNAFVQEHGREPTADELSEILEITEEKIVSAMRSSIRHASLDKPMGDDGDAGTLLDVVPDDSEEDADSALTGESLRHDLDVVLDFLCERDAEVVRCFYGIGCTEMSLEEIAEKYELSRERVRQIKEKAVRKLSRPAVRNRLRQYLG